MTVEVRRHKTAIQRNGLSRPLRLAHEAGLIVPPATLFDYGCGKGGDLSIVRNLGIPCTGWDPVHRPDAARTEADVVNLGYVVNVIEDPEERADALRRAWTLARRILIVAARLTVEAKGANHRDFNDGCLTRRDTFQKFYTQHELREWIDSTLAVESMAAAPGVFFVFRDERLRQSFASARYRRPASAPRQRLSDALFQEHRELLQELMEFFARRGRLPDPSEAGPGRVEAAFGSVRRAFALVRRVTGSEQWDRIRDERAQDLLVYTALAQFTRRPRFTGLPRDLQLDLKAFYGTYAKACARG